MAIMPRTGPDSGQPTSAEPSSAEPSSAEPRSRRDRPAKPPLSRDGIIDAALRLVAQEGIDAVTLRRVGQLLDTGAASLYVYLANRDDLLERMFDRVLSDVPVVGADPGGWRAQLLALYTEVLAALDRYPGVAQAGLGIIPAGPGALRITENTLAALRAGRIGEQAAAWACDALLLFTTASAVEHAIERRRAPATAQQKAVGVDYAAGALAVFSGLSADRYPTLAQMAEVMVQGADAERFRFGISTLLNGLVPG
jgi:AcrR family transcriptional regulator